MSDSSQENLAERQFGPRAQAYLASAVHARGADLDALLAVASSRAGGRMLDVGCGAGHVSFGLAAHAGEVVACDLSPDMLRIVEAEARRLGLSNLTTAQGRAERLPFPSESFDAVLTRFSAHHWPDLDAALREVARVLKPEGLFGVVDVVSPGEPLLDTWLQTMELVRDPSHVRDYSVAEWSGALARAGLQLQQVGASRLPLAFAPWIERMATPARDADAIRALQAKASQAVARHFGFGPQGDFIADVALFTASKPGGRPMSGED
jgi:ubiquinone/menaquinone biosynthesis C-methylase UbiE